MTASLRVEPASITVVIGKTVKLNAVFSEDNNFNIGVPITWEMADPQIASIGTDGRVKGLKPGCTTVRARAKGESASAVVIVNFSSSMDNEDEKPPREMIGTREPALEPKEIRQPIKDLYVSASKPSGQKKETLPANLQFTFLEEPSKPPCCEPTVLLSIIAQEQTLTIGNTLFNSVRPKSVSSAYIQSKFNLRTTFSSSISLSSLCEPILHLQ